MRTRSHWNFYEQLGPIHCSCISFCIGLLRIRHWNNADFTCNLTPVPLGSALYPEQGWERCWSINWNVKAHTAGQLRLDMIRMQTFTGGKFVNFNSISVQTLWAILIYGPADFSARYYCHRSLVCDKHSTFGGTNSMRKFVNEVIISNGDGKFSIPVLP